jgi:Mrp family chromosome partitioning ATPase
MRLPMQSRYVGVEQGEGLSSLLSDTNLKAADLIQTVTENFNLLPAGPKPPDPAKLLNSQRCQEVVDEIRQISSYDIVLWDAPPCLMLADPILLGEKLDGILFLVGLGKVSRDMAPQACRRIQASGVDVLGLICNQTNFPGRLNDYGYEYGYYYHYAYAGSYAGTSYGRRGYGRYGGTSYGRYGGSRNYVQGYINSHNRQTKTADGGRTTAGDNVERDKLTGSPEHPYESRTNQNQRSRRDRSPVKRAVSWIRHRLGRG